jgi:hypothetical protein
MFELVLFLSFAGLIVNFQRDLAKSEAGLDVTKTFIDEIHMGLKQIR